MTTPITLGAYAIASPADGIALLGRLFPGGATVLFSRNVAVPGRALIASNVIANGQPYTVWFDVTRAPIAPAGQAADTGFFANQPPLQTALIAGGFALALAFILWNEKLRKQQAAQPQGSY